MQYRRERKTKKRTYFLVTIIVLIGVPLAIGQLNGWWEDTAVQSNIPEETITNAIVETPLTATSEPVNEDAIYPPDFILSDLYDEDISYILSQYKGRPVILNFWASWCGPCRVEMPAFQAAYEQYEADGLVILAVNQTFIDDEDAAREFADEMGLTFPLLRDDDGRVSESLYGVRGLPTTVIIRPDGTTAFAQIGPMNDAQIADISRRLVTGEAVP